MLAELAVHEPDPAAAKPASLASSLPELKTWQLDNGLRVAYMGIRKAPVVTVDGSQIRRPSRAELE